MVRAVAIPAGRRGRWKSIEAWAGRRWAIDHEAADQETGGESDAAGDSGVTVGVPVAMVVVPRERRAVVSASGAVISSVSEILREHWLRRRDRDDGRGDHGCYFLHGLSSWES